MRRSMLMSGGDPSVFVIRPLSLAFITATVLIPWDGGADGAQAAAGGRRCGAGPRRC